MSRPDCVPANARRTDNPDGSVSWSWGDPEKDEDCGTYTTNLPDLVVYHDAKTGVISSKPTESDMSLTEEFIVSLEASDAAFPEAERLYSEAVARAEKDPNKYVVISFKDMDSLNTFTLALEILLGYACHFDRDDAGRMGLDFVSASCVFSCAPGYHLNGYLQLSKES